MDIVIVPDAHVRSGVSIKRFEALGNYVMEHQPSHVVQLGDWADMPSLSSYDVGKKSFEGRTYKADVKSVNASIDLFEQALEEPSRRAKKKRTYFPIKKVLKGNHENRIVRAVALDSKLDGTITYDDFDFARKGWGVTEFLDSLVIEGVAFSHYFVSGLMGKPIGGENPASTLIKKQFISCVTGHSHLYDFAERTDANGRKIMALVAGCFLAQDQVEDYAGPSQKMWRNCITHLKNVHNGEFDFEVISTERLESNY